MNFDVQSIISDYPALLQPSEATAFAYEVIGISGNPSNDISKIYTFGGELKYSHLFNKIFIGNLLMIDTKFECMIAEMLLHSYTKNLFKCKQLIEYLEQINPLNFERNEMYTYKFKQFLYALALGMTPSEAWSGEYRKNVASVLYDQKNFKQHLLEHTEFNRNTIQNKNISTIYESEGKIYINLRLGILFTD